MSLRPRGMHRRIAMLSAKHPESRDLSPSAKHQCERGLTSLGRFSKTSEGTTKNNRKHRRRRCLPRGCRRVFLFLNYVNMTSKLLLLASRNGERKKERKKRLEIAGNWLYSSRGSRLVDRLSHFNLRRRRTVSISELPVQGLGRLTMLSLVLL